MRAAADAGLLAAVLVMVPFPGAFLIAVPLAGFVCVRLFRKRAGGGAVSAGTAFRLGALAGLFGSLIFLLVTAAATLVFHAENQMREAMIQSIHQAQSRAVDAQARETLNYFLSPQGLLVMMIIGAVLVTIVFALLGGLGGALSASASSKSHSE